MQCAQTPRIEGGRVCTLSWRWVGEDVSATVVCESRIGEGMFFRIPHATDFEGVQGITGPVLAAYLFANSEASALPCPTPEFIKPKHSPTLLRWAFALQQQRVEVTRKLADMHGGSEDEAARILGGLGRAVRVLPLWSCHTHAICVYPTSLAALAQLSGEAVGKKRKRAEEDASADGGDLAPPALDFWRFFPGAKRLLKGGRGGTLSLHPFIRTDGITASVTMKRRAPASEAGAAQKRGGEFKTPVLDRGAAKPAPAAHARGRAGADERGSEGAAADAELEAPARVPASTSDERGTEGAADGAPCAVRSDVDAAAPPRAREDERPEARGVADRFSTGAGSAKVSRRWARLVARAMKAAPERRL